ncbi:unnamed protein product [Caenorhabditis bovis]|uniref:CUB domain-containing protein n=1 Tax=Caenorhabditis bovis TaxID=2654633 RepID=A0A8S1EIT2_9PELO|nr:unnamed protein product [Caenorhabditis bovis]
MFMLLILQAVATNTAGLWRESIVECGSYISNEGDYSYSGEEDCMITVQVPSHKIAETKLCKDECHEAATNGNYTINIGNGINNQLSIRMYDVFFKSCDDIAKNIHEYNGKTIVLRNEKGQENSSKGVTCKMQLPANVRVHLLTYNTKRRKKCCPDVVLGSGNELNKIVKSTMSVSACEIDRDKQWLHSSCHSTWLYLRNPAIGDELIFRIEEIELETWPVCITMPPIPLHRYTCKKRERFKKARRTSTYSFEPRLLFSR